MTHTHYLIIEIYIDKSALTSCKFFGAFIQICNTQLTMLK